MRAQPDPNADPYRTLGLEPGASNAEVKRAYRLLAKAFHPDSAGDAATPRFLAIQDAYEHLKSGKAPAAPRASRAGPPPAAGEAWRADPERARAARERARSARNGTGRRTGASTAGSPPGSAAGSASGTAPGAGRGSGRRRDARKATMGSTTYDEARDEVRDPTDATWSGASWYGPSSGEYWIINPREYADPRKHGPEYQQRARRPLGSDGGDAEAPATDATDATDAAAASARTASARGRTSTSTATGAGTGRGTSAASRGTAAASTGPRDDAGAASRPGWARRDPEAFGDPNRATLRPGEAIPDLDRAEALGAASRTWLGGPADDPVRRLGLALVAWPPIGLAAAAAIGEATGCTTFSAACSGSEPLLPWLAQAVILGLLLLLPPVSRLLAGGAIAALIALVPITGFLLAVGGSGAPQAAPVMVTLLAAAWLAGIAWSARTFRRRVPGAIA
ncbi:MAG: J domain-containing protein [Chloroflexota bacterium]